MLCLSNDSDFGWYFKSRKIFKSLKLYVLGLYYGNDGID